MMCGNKLLVFTAVVLLLPTVAVAQSPPQDRPPVSPKVESLDPTRCAPSDTRSTVGKGGPVDEQSPSGANLSDKLAQSGGVICPPEMADPEIKQPTPPGGAAMPVIPPPGSPGGDHSVQPK